MIIKYLLYIGAAILTLGTSTWVSDSVSHISNPYQREYIVTHMGW